MGGDTPIEQAGPIRLLPDELVDQIAAGEVVERPASVVKELVENALDARAGRVRVDLREGGNALIAVTDDGIGMTAEAARLALRRHATSKIGVLSDLDRIASFGFRGEALPAIASVSRLRLLTRARGADAGCEIRVEGGAVQLERAAGCPEGTRVEVADLFAAVPARRKFLKKPATEWGHVIDWLGRLAMALPGVHFEVSRDDREPIVWPATPDPRARIEAVLGREQAGALQAVTLEDVVGHVEAWASPPDVTRANANAVHLYVNGRPVRDRLLRHAVLESYRDWLPRGRYPVAVVFLTVDPAAVDVNVHPAKWEVRFAEPQAIHRLVRHALRQAMGERAYLAPDAGPRPATGFDAGRRPMPASAPPGAATQGSDWLFASKRSSAEVLRDRAPSDPATAAAPEAPVADEPRVKLGSLPLLGQLLASYLVLEVDDGMILIDQHAAHERVLYERLRASWLDAGVARQGLLVPVDVPLDPLAAAALAEASETVLRLGFEIERFGEDAVVVRAIPALLSGHDPAALVRELAEELARGDGVGDEGAGATRLLAAADRVFATLACHSARRFGDHLPVEEQRAILDGLDSVPWAPTCPHGRPVATRLDRAEIERRFGRR